MPIVEVEHLAVTYGDVVAVDDVTFSAEEGAITVVLGPNGAGKTSTIECLEGYRTPSSGRVRVCGLDPIADHAELTRRIGVMLQAGGVPTAIRPAEVLRQYAAFYDQPRDPIELLGFVGLDHRAGAAYRTLSGGEQQRLSLALALVGRPDVVFLDEPTAGVDVGGRQLIRELIRSLAHDGVTVLLTTHDLGEVETLAHRIVIVDGGHVVADGSPAELLAADQDRFTFRAAPALDTSALGAALRGTVTEESPGNYAVALAPTPTTVAALTAWLAEREVLLGDLQAGRRGLEEVFLKLTSEADAVDRTDGASNRRSRRSRT